MPLGGGEAVGQDGDGDVAVGESTPAAAEEETAVAETMQWRAVAGGERGKKRGDG